jgi:trk system potassium uptake protein TrkH
VLRYYLSRLALALGCLTLIPAVFSLAQGEWRLALSLFATVGLTGLLWAAGRGVGPLRDVQVNEALAVVALAFMLAILLMVLPFRAAGLRWEDALFESVSAITTTGLTTLAQVHDRSASFLFLRAWLQWYGGLGIAVFSLALVMGHHAGARRLADTHTPENLPTSAKAYARQVLTTYLTLTLVALAALWLALGDGLAALLHALTAVSTGGFSSYDNSLADMAPAAGPYVAIGAAMLGAMPLILYYQLATGRSRDLSGDPEWWMLPLAVLIFAFLLALVLRYEEGMVWSSALLQGLLMGSSAQTTTGFSSLEVGALSDTAKLLLVVSMFIGGSVGSTAGGIKLLRLLITVELTLFMLRRTSMPTHAVARMRVGGRALEGEEIQRALVIVVLFVAAVSLSWIVMIAWNFPAVDALFEIVSATATVGLSTGIVSEGLPTGPKLLLCVNMLLGRLEILALLVVLYPPTWLGRRTDI